MMHWAKPNVEKNVLEAFLSGKVFRFPNACSIHIVRGKIKILHSSVEMEKVFKEHADLITRAEEFIEFFWKMKPKVFHTFSVEEGCQEVIALQAIPKKLPILPLSTPEERSDEEKTLETLEERIQRRKEKKKRDYKLASEKKKAAIPEKYGPPLSPEMIQVLEHKRMIARKCNARRLELHKNRKKERARETSMALPELCDAE